MIFFNKCLKKGNKISFWIILLRSTFAENAIRYFVKKDDQMADFFPVTISIKIVTVSCKDFLMHYSFSSISNCRLSVQAK